MLLRYRRAENKNGARIEIQPRFKIQYPMKNHGQNTIGFLIMQVAAKISFK